MTQITARKITAVIRELFPGIRPLTTHRDLSDNGLVLGFTVTMPEPAARNWGVSRLAGTGPASEYLSRHLGTEVHIVDVYASRRVSGGLLVHLKVKTGAS